VAPRKLRNCQNQLEIESKTADEVPFFNIRAPISFERLKLESSNLVCVSNTRGSYDRMQKLGQRKHDPVKVTNILI